MLTILLISFFSGILTVLAPCVLPLLPVILGGSLAGRDIKRPYIIIVSLVTSLLLFTFLLKASTILIQVNPDIWEYISGGLLILFSVTLIFPRLWTRLMEVTGVDKFSQNSLESASQKEGIWGSIAIGAALGPVFSSCNPTYTVLLATILPASITMGLIGLLAYFIGLGMILLLIVYFGRSIIGRFAFFSNPYGVFRKFLGIIMLIVGLLIMTGYMKKIETFIIEKNVFINTNMIDHKLNEVILKNHQNTNMCLNGKCSKRNSGKSQIDLRQAPELVGITSWVNSEPLTLESLGGKIVLIDFWTYSCINCIRTQPYLNAWHEKYSDEGLVIIGVHAPEFAFEKIERNVREASQKAGIQYPIALDNDFTTWNAYANRYWPAKYLIDQEGNIVYKHFGEGKYEETEEKIQELLGMNNEEGIMYNDGLLNDSENTTPRPAGTPLDRGARETKTPEIYLGSARGKNLLGDLQGENYYGSDLRLDIAEWGLQGEWFRTLEYIEAGNDVGPPGLNSGEALLALRFSAKKVFLVVSSESKKGRLAVLTINPNGVPEKEEEIQILEDGIYTIFESTEFQKDQLIYLVASPGLRLHAFTFAD